MQNTKRKSELIPIPDERIFLSKFDAAFALVPAICFITDGETIDEANQAFLSFFGCDSTKAFLEKYRCVCNLIVERDGFLHTVQNGLPWVKFLIGQPDKLHKILLKTPSGDIAFSIMANTFQHEDQQRYIVLMARLSDEDLSQENLLRQYKNVVDRSAIVSKTDPHGKITYINDRFCEISGYARDELMGQPHNIIRHPDMPPQTFQKMWETISGKKPWYGIIKNKKKDGSSYYVDTVINPVLDYHGNLIEFIAIRYDVTHLETMKINLYEELEDTQKELIYRLGEISESRSLETGNHVKRVAEYSKLLALKAGLSEHDASLLHLASPMHDIGKVSIPDSILHKTGKLSAEEWKIMRSHCENGFLLLKSSERPILKAAAIVAYEHHEKWNGKGYPRGLSGEAIHIFGRITSLADVFDALGSHRSYKDAWNDQAIFDYIKNERGRHFDPALVDIFFDNLDAFLQIREIYREKH